MEICDKGDMVAQYLVLLWLLPSLLMVSRGWRGAQTVLGHCRLRGPAGVPPEPPWDTAATVGSVCEDKLGWVYMKMLDKSNYTFNKAPRFETLPITAL